MIYYSLRWFAIILLGLLIYGQTFQYGFVFDDHIFIATNPFIKNFNNIHVMWQAFPTTRLIGMYSFALNYYFNQLHPQGYHIFNFIVHLTATGLVWALAGLLVRKELAFFVAVLFLVHPGQTQAVTYITQRFESIATVFYLSTVYFYLRARLLTDKTHKIVLFGLAGLSTVLGILTKEVIVTVPLMILASEWILFPSKNKKGLYAALVIIGLFFCVILSKMLHAGFDTFLHASIPSESHDGDILTTPRYLMTQLRVFLTFLRLLIWPIHQNLDYDYPASSGLLNPPLTLVGLSVILGFIALIIKLRRKYPSIAFGLAWVLITFSINLAPRSNVIFEHKLYLISFGFFLAIVSTLDIWIKNRMVLIKIICCLAAVLSIISYHRNKVWANELVLWEDVIKESPHKARVNASLGRVYGSLGRYDESIYYLSRAIAIKPDNITYENRGVIYSQQGHYDQALEDLNKSIAMDPTYFNPYVKRSWVFQTQHRYQEALADLAHVIGLEPYFADAYIERGMLWMTLGRAEEAMQDFQQALKIEPFNYQVLLKRGEVYYSLGHYDLALADFTKAQALEPDSTEAAQYKSLCLKKM